MISIKGFRAYRPPQDLVEKVASVPYDVINKVEAQQLTNDNPYSFLHITRSEVDLPATTEVYSQAVYDMARSNFLNFVEKGWLVQDDDESLYIYRQTMGEHVQTGIIALSSNEDYAENRIKKHEFTRPVKEQDRINNMKTAGIHPGPVFLTYRHVSEITEFVKHYTEQYKAVYDFIADDSIGHSLWCISDESKVQELVKLFKQKVPASYIADGHHRAASSAKVGNILAQENKQHSDDASYNYFLTVLFPDNEMKILDYNRLVADLNGLTDTDFLKAIESDFTVSLIGTQAYRPEMPRCFGLYINKTWYKLIAKQHTYREDDPINTLDITTISNHFLSKHLGIIDQRTDQRIDFVGGIRGLAELEKRVDSGEWKMAISLHPVGINQLIEIADSGEVMPPKSTWFEPKLRSGLVVHRFA